MTTLEEAIESTFSELSEVQANFDRYAALHPLSESSVQQYQEYKNNIKMLKVELSKLKIMQAENPDQLVSLPKIVVPPVFATSTSSHVVPNVQPLSEPVSSLQPAKLSTQSSRLQPTLLPRIPGPTVRRAVVTTQRGAAGPVDNKRGAKLSSLRK